MLIHSGSVRDSVNIFGSWEHNSLVCVRLESGGRSIVVVGVRDGFSVSSILIGLGSGSGAGINVRDDKIIGVGLGFGGNDSIVS